LTYEQLENNQVRINFAMEPEAFRKAIDEVYKKERGSIHIQGFRKGKAPRKIIEMNYGESYFHIEAINHILTETYEKAIEDFPLDIVSTPEFDVISASEKEGAFLTALVYIKPDIQLEKEYYMNVPHGKLPSLEVTDEEIQESLEKTRSQNSRLLPLERPLQKGDIVNIDFVGYIKGEIFEGGSAKNHELTLGNGAFIPGFEEQLEGAEIGQTVEVNVTFPEDYHEHLAGQSAMFKVVINDAHEIQLPDLDDDFAQDVSEFDTLEEYKNHVKEEILKVKETAAKDIKLDKVLRYLGQNFNADFPEAMIEDEIDALSRNFARDTYMRTGRLMEDHLKNAGMSDEIFRTGFYEQAEANVKIRLILEKIAQLENIEISQEELEEELLRYLSTTSNKDPKDFLAEASKEQVNEIILNLKRRKASIIVMDNAVEVEDDPLNITEVKITDDSI